MIPQGIKNLPWWAISLSLGVNAIVLVAAMLLIRFFHPQTQRIVLGFLCGHIVIVQPLKDWLVSLLDRSVRYATQTTFLTFENRIARIMHVQDCIEFLSWLIRAWKLQRLRLLIFDEEDFVYFFTPNKRARKMRLKDEISEDFRHELASFPGARVVSNLSTPLRSYLQARKVKLIVPLMFRDRLIGLIGFSELIDKIRLPLVDRAAYRMGLALENDQLERNVPRSEFLKKEFRLAEKIERHLSGPSTYKAGSYVIQKLDTAWEKKHFAAIFGCTQNGVSDSTQAFAFAMLLRLSVASTRSNALQLFSTQGYFYALCRNETKIANLALALHKSLSTNENNTVALEGFLLAIPERARDKVSGRSIEIVAFGSHLAYRDTNGWTWVKDTAPLGIGEPETRIAFELKAQKEVILSMREYPLILITGGAA